MTAEATVYEKTYEDYIAALKRIDLAAVEAKLGVQVRGHEVIIPLFGKPHKVSESGVTNPIGRQPSLDICVILCKYLLLCPDAFPQDKEWAAFRDFRESAPLLGYFAHQVEHAIAAYFAGRPGDVEKAAKTLGGVSPAIEVPYDVSIQVPALPQVPILVLYNDADEEFPAKCSVLFERRAEIFLDAECLAMLGRLLFTYLKKAEI